MVIKCKPMIQKWIKIYEEDEHVLKVHDELYGKTYYINKDHENLLKQCDSKTDVNQIIENHSDEEEAKIMLRIFYENNLIRKQKHVFLKNRYSTYYTVWVAKNSKKLYSLGKMYTCLLILMWLPSLLIGIFLYGKTKSSYVEYASWINALLFVGIAVISIVAHEFSHVMAAISLRGKVFECGITASVLSPGAYTLMNVDACGRLGRVQISAAGVQSNIMIIGLSLILYYFYPSSICIISVTVNIGLTIMNMGFSSSLDGYSIITELLGINVDFINALKEVFNKCDKKKVFIKLKDSSEGDKLILLNAIIILSCQLFPVLLSILIFLLLIGV